MLVNYTIWTKNMFTLSQIQSIFDYGMTAYTQAYKSSRKDAINSAAADAGAATTVANKEAKMAAKVKHVVMVAGMEATVFNVRLSGNAHRVAFDKQFATSFNAGLKALFAVELIKTNENQTYLYGRGYYHIGLYNEAIATLEAAIVDDPPCLPHAYYYLGKSHTRIKNHEIAKTYFLRLIEWEKNPALLSDYYDNIGMCCFEQKHDDEARLNYERAIQYNSTNSSAQHNLALLYLTMATRFKNNEENFNEHYLNSQNLLDAILEREPNHPQALHTRGSLFELTEHYDQAISFYLQARQHCAIDDTDTLAAIRTNLAESYTQAGHNHYQSKNDVTAGNFYKKALEEDPLHDIAKSQSGMALFKMGDFTGAREHFNSLINFPISANSNQEEHAHNQEIRADAWMNRAACLRKTGTFNLSKGALDMAKDLAPDDTMLPHENKELAAARIQHHWRFFQQNKQGVILPVLEDTGFKFHK